MGAFTEFLAAIDNEQHRRRTTEVLSWVSSTFTNLVPKIAWNQPMFTDHGTFIIGFSVSKHHLAVSPEPEGIVRFSEEIIISSYEHTKNLFHIKWEDTVDYALLERIIRFNISEKAEYSLFWRKG